VAVPLLAHLLAERGGRLAEVPTVRFIRRASAEVARFSRLRHWLLMLLRVAALAAVVIAFTQPVWYRQAPADDRQTGYLVAVIVDRSASMGRVERGASLFDRARRQADDLLARLDPTRDQAAVILLDRQPRSLLPEPTANLSLLRRELSAVSPTLERGDLSAALALATQLERGDWRLRVELFTDDQATQHVDLLAVPGLELDHLTTHRVGEPAENLALARADVEPAHPIAGQAATVSVEVANHSDQAREVAVLCTVEGVARRARARLEPWTQSSVAFDARFERAGLNDVRFAIEANDAMPDDDTAGLVAVVAERRPVMLITAADPDNETNGVFFLSRAIEPEAGGVGGASLRVVRPEEVTGLPRSDRPVVYVVAEVGRLPESAVEELRRRVEAGDGLIWFADSQASVDALALLGEASPITPVHRAAGAFTERRRTFGSARFDHEVLSILPGPGRSSLLQVAFDRTMDGTLRPPTEALIDFDDGQPAAAIGGADAGRIAVIAADISLGSSAFVKNPAFVPFVHELIRHVAPGPVDDTPPFVGEAMATKADRHWVGPAGQALDARAVARVDKVGPYQLIDSATGQVVDGRWVGIDPAEGDLRIAGREGLQGATDLAGQAAVGGPVLRPVGVELWPYLALAALLLLLAEPLVLYLAGGRGWRRVR
jgi:hypothetical protein